ncbi:hypothetical protein HanIR_Chr13g0647671 [Helianthus annuus]|nr:hypothetical protein HanIR_Chr13g0647671 [Helianthus annuus]
MSLDIHSRNASMVRTTCLCVSTSVHDHLRPPSSFLLYHIIIMDKRLLKNTSCIVLKQGLWNKHILL